MECFDRSRFAKAANVNLLIVRTGRERRVRLPVHVKSGSRVKGELLFAMARRRIPDDRRSINAGRENIIAFLVPFQGKDRSLVLTQRTG